MPMDLNDLNAFIAVARAGGFRDAGRAGDTSASRLSDAVRRLEARMGVRLFNRTTRSVVLTEAGSGLLSRLAPAMAEVDAALDEVNGYRDKPAGTLKLNVPLSAARLVLPAIVPRFLAAYPDIRLEVMADENLIDVLAAGCDAGVRYEERLELDMIAVPIGPRVQRFAVAGSPAYLDARGRPGHPREVIQHDCLLGRFPSGAMVTWEFERDGEVVRIDPAGPLTVQIGGAVDLAIEAAVAGSGLVYLFEDWLKPYVDRGLLEPVLQEWWPRISGPYLYYSGRRLVPSPLKAFIEFIKTPHGDAGRGRTTDAAKGSQ